MVVLEVSLSSGFTVFKLKMKVETKEGDTVAIIYFVHFTLYVNAYKQFDVAEQKPSLVIIYGYYISGEYSIRT